MTDKQNKSTNAAMKMTAQNMIRMIERAIENGERLPWNRPWFQRWVTHSNQNGTPYAGFNSFWLSMFAGEKGFKSTVWFTAKGFQKWAAKDGQKFSFEGMGAPKDEDGNIDFSASPWTGVVGFFPSKRMPKGLTEDEKAAWNASIYRIPRVFKVWNGDSVSQEQLDKMPQLAQFIADNQAPEPPKVDNKSNMRVETLLSMYADATGLSFSHGGDSAFYRPSTDHIQMPPQEVFKTSEGYYGTLLHEIAHSTGSSKRLSRKGVMGSGFTSKKVYSQEELVAEMSQTMVCTAMGIEPQSDNSAAYMKGWLKALDSNPEFLYRAVKPALEASEYILGHEPEEDVSGFFQITEPSPWGVVAEVA